MGLSERHQSEFDAEFEGKYELLDAIGAGGMGRVVLARHRQLKELVAIKVLRSDRACDEALTRFVREARTAAKLRSPHVARVMDAGIMSNGHPYMVMEYLQGRDLSTLVKRGARLPSEQAVDFILQALEGVAEAHSLGVIHRDLKPGNLFASELPGGETCIKVLDFGIAKVSGGLETADSGVTEKGSVLGTPSYMPPEQLADSQDVDARSDIWSIGAILFELLTGMPAFRERSLPQLYAAVVQGSFTSLRRLRPELPKGLETIVGVCLMPSRALRYASVAELSRALEAYGGPRARDHVERIARVLAAGSGGRPVEVDASSAARRTSLLTQDTQLNGHSQTLVRIAIGSLRWWLPVFVTAGSLAFFWITRLPDHHLTDGPARPTPSVPRPMPVPAAVSTPFVSVPVELVLSSEAEPLLELSQSVAPEPSSLPPAAQRPRRTRARTSRAGKLPARIAASPIAAPVARSGYDQYP